MRTPSEDGAATMHALRWDVPVRRIEWFARTVHVYAVSMGNDMPLKL
jgi:hypothetical protein